jgi:ribose transport system ATP-binding protein
MVVFAVASDALLNAAPSGVVLRGFGANPQAMIRSGWSPLRTAMLRYAIAGGYTALAGLALTAINTASDINAGASYTLLGIAAVDRRLRIGWWSHRFDRRRLRRNHTLADR